MTAPEVLLVSVLALSALLVLALQIYRRQVGRADLWDLSLGAAVVGTGLVLESDLVGGKAPLQALVVGLVALAVVPRLLDLRSRGSVDQHPLDSRLALLMVALSVTALMVNLSRNPLAPPLEVYSRVLAPVFWTLVTLVVLLGGLHRRGFVLGALTAFLGVVALTPFYPRPLAPCVVDKCSVFGSLLTGPYGSENFLSVVGGSVLFLALARGRDPFGLLVTATAGVTMLAAGGRGSLLAAGVGLVAAAVLSTPTARRWLGFAGAGGRRVLSLLAVSAFVLVAVILLVRADSTDFSRRGNVWRRGLAVVREDWLFGVGLSRWDGYEGVAAVSHHYPHSQYLLILFSAGAVGLVLYAALMGAVLSSALSLTTGSTRDGPWLAGHVAFLLTIGLVEVVLNPLSVDGLSWVLLAHLLPGAPASSGPDRRRPSLSRDVDAMRV